jgi:FixJ family two-component response regulator
MWRWSGITTSANKRKPIVTPRQTGNRLRLPEQEVLFLVVSGLLDNNRREFGTGEITVKVHRCQLLRKKVRIHYPDW